jgi:acetyl esterase/lipase
MQTETIVLNAERKVSLTTYLQPVGGEFGNIKKRPAMLVIPGGGYFFCSDREAEPIALSYMAAGFNAFVLRYSLEANAAWPQPLKDYEEAIDLIRSRADEWFIDSQKVAIIGFSAGGHLAASAATLSKEDSRPNAAILGYPLTNTDVQRWNKSAPSTISAVDKKTPPCFLFHTRTDDCVPVKNTIDFIAALDAAGVGFETHIYSYGPHGYSLGTSALGVKDISSRAPHWLRDSIEWLKEVLGDFD